MLGTYDSAVWCMEFSTAAIAIVPPYLTPYPNITCCLLLAMLSAVADRTRGGTSAHRQSW